MNDGTYNASAEQKREWRSLLLDYVNAVYPASIRQAELVEVMCDLPEPLAEDHVLRDLQYLAQRGLIEREDGKHPVTGTRQLRWRLTAAGVTFVERGKPWRSLEGV